MDAEAAFYPLQRGNFNDRLVIDLPRSVEAYALAPNQWICTLESDHIEARIFIVAGDQTFADEDGDPVSIDSDLFEKTLQKFIADQGAERDFTRVPGGAIAYEVYDTAPSAPDPGEPIDWRSGPLRNHLWRRLCFEPGKMRNIQFLLWLPLERAETPYAAALVKLLDREIRRAELPGFPSPKAETTA